MVVMANGLAGNEELHEQHPDWSSFQEALTLVCEDLAKQIARDGEGATKLIEVTVKGAHTDGEANVVAKKVVGSSLVKTALFGGDPNWGRIVGAMGHSDIKIQPELCCLAERAGGSTDQPPDGGCRNRRDLPGAALAVDQASGRGPGRRTEADVGTL